MSRKALQTIEIWLKIKPLHESESEKSCRGDMRRFEEMLDRKNVKTFVAPILLQNSLKPSLGQYESTQKISALYL